MGDPNSLNLPLLILPFWVALFVDMYITLLIQSTCIMSLGVFLGGKLVLNIHLTITAPDTYPRFESCLGKLPDVKKC